MNAEQDCLFCKLLAGDGQATFVHRDDVCSAFMDIQPVNPGHLLLIPNRHASCLAELTEAEGAWIFRIAQRLAAALRISGLRCEGVNFFLADGKAAMQEILHVHLHVFPRYEGDGFGLQFGPGYSVLPARQELETAASLIQRSTSHATPRD